MSSNKAWSKKEFEERLRAKGNRYHIHHPFNVAMREGKLSREQLRGWVANRFYYQLCIPQKDAAVMANCDDRETRRRWVQRILDHDGWEGNAGGIEAWSRLGEAVGINKDVLWSQELVLPGVRFAVDAYVNFARRAPWQEAVCSSLTEMFAPEIHKQRLSNWPKDYKWVSSEGLNYFRSRISLAQRDVEHGLEVTLSYFKTRAQQERALEILQFKLDVLWSMSDAIALAYPNQRKKMNTETNPPLPEHPKLNRLFRLQYEEAQKTHVLLYPEGMVKLNQSASEILLLCNGTRTVGDIVAALEAKFNASGLEADVRSMLAEATRRNWLDA